jgi:hypothetical protein
MTERTIQVSMTADMAEAVCAYVDDQRSKLEPVSRARVEELDRIDGIALSVMQNLNLMSRATNLYEGDDIVLFEHPIKGDEAPVMAYIKADQVFDEDTQEWDSDEATARTVLENHRAAFRSF